MESQVIDELRARLERVEDELAIRRVILSYGPAADAGLASKAASVWFDDGVYDWDGKGEPHEGSAAVERMLDGDGHQRLIAAGAAHFAGPPLIDVHGDHATAVNYSFVVRSEDSRYYLWRVSAVRWDLERAGSSWRVRRRTNRLLDELQGGRQLFAEVLGGMT